MIGIESWFPFFRGVLGVENVSVEQLLEKAKEQGEVYVTTLTAEQVQELNSKLGLDDDFEDEDEEEQNSIGYDHVDIYLMYDGGYKLKYIFDNDFENAYYVHENDVFGRQFLLGIILQYLSFSVKDK